MKVALIGASGQAGSRILKELSHRGHEVTAIARNPEKIAALPGVVSEDGRCVRKAPDCRRCSRATTRRSAWLASPRAIRNC